MLEIFLLLVITCFVLKHIKAVFIIYVLIIAYGYYKLHQKKIKNKELK